MCHSRAVVIPTIFHSTWFFFVLSHSSIFLFIHENFSFSFPFMNFILSLFLFVNFILSLFHSWILFFLFFFTKIYLLIFIHPFFSLQVLVFYIKCFPCLFHYFSFVIHKSTCYTYSRYDEQGQFWYRSVPPPPCPPTAAFLPLTSFPLSNIILVPLLLFFILNHCTSILSTFILFKRLNNTG